MSHLPHVLAFAFARALGEAPAGARDLAGPGFRDFTRIARSDAELWADILVANAKAVAGPLACVAAELAAVARGLEAGDADALERWIAEARARLAERDGRETMKDLARSGGANPEIQATLPRGPEGSSKQSHE
jgi:prephenate dehydrogenase